MDHNERNTVFPRKIQILFARDRSIQSRHSSSHLSPSVLDWLRIRDLARESTSFLTFHVLPPSLPRSSPTSHVDVSSKASLQPNPTFPEYFDPPTLQVFALFEGFSFFFFLSIPPVFFPSFYYGMAGWIREGYKAFLPTQKGVVNEIRLSLFFFLFFNLSTSLLRCMHGFEIFIII